MYSDYADLLTVEEVAEMLRMGRNAVYMLLAERKLKGFRNGRVWRIPKQAVEEYIIKNAKLTN